MASTLGEDAIKTVEMTSEGLEYDITQLIKQWGEDGLYFERSSTVGKML